jgi:DNA-binding transcriptional regulator YhcF (GntR family)
MTEERPQKLTINATTGEQIYEDLTDEEIEEIRVFTEQEAARRAAAEAEAEAKAEAKASAIAKLKALGLTEEEAAEIAGA